MGARAHEPSGEVFRDLVAGIPIALVVVQLTDTDDPRSLTILAANPAATSLANVEPSAVGSRLADVLAVPDDLLVDLAGLVTSERPHADTSVEIDGIQATLSIQAVPMPDDCIGISMEDVTVRTRTAAALRHQATHDDLTGLANRVLLNERLADALAESERTGAQVAVLLIDLDQFKDVNDTLGHDCGDSLLRGVAARMQSQLRACDTVARIGGDEFAVLLTTDVTTAAAEDVARRLADLAAEPIDVDGYRLRVSASVGVAIAPRHGTDPVTLMRRADEAMYQAKAAGGNHITYSGQQERTTDRRLGLLTDLRGGRFRSELEILFQPRIELAEMGAVGVEALSRWRHPQHGLLAPAEFIELAEISGGIRAVTELVTERALDALRVLDGHGLRTASVNISTRNLVDPGWVDAVCESLTTSQLPPGSLWMELTEGQLMDDPRQSEDALERLHIAGVRFSIDDFGSGSSSLALVRDLPVDEVKIDRRFVEDLRQGDDRIVRSIIDLGHHLGLIVTAEGVADHATLDALRSMGCDLAQGWALSPPLPLDELVTHLGGSLQPKPPTTWKPPVTDG